MTEARKSSRQMHTPRRLARVFALLGVYEWIADPEREDEKNKSINEIIATRTAGLVELLGEDGAAVEGIDVTPEDFDHCDRELLDLLYTGVLREHEAVEETFREFVDRDLKRVSLVERAILFLGTFELMRCPQTPYRVAINEAIELAKRFGSGYRFTNAVLEGVAKKVRPEEFAADHTETAKA